jgi:tetratricopeptide (TPR) repeat protein
MENINSHLAQLEKEPDNTSLLITIGKYYQFNANYEDAKKFFKMALKVNPDSYETYYHLGCQNSVHLYFPYLYKAIALAKKYHDHDFASKVISYISEHYTSLGDEYFESEDVTKATYYFKKAIATNPNCTTAYNGLGHYYYYVKMNYPKAKIYYQISIKTSKIVEHSDSNTRYWKQLNTRPYMRALHGLGLCNFHLGHRIYDPLLLNESLNIFNKMLRLNPDDNQGVRYLISDVYLKDGAVRRSH